MPAPLDLTGRRFGKLVVIQRNGTAKFGRAMTAWICRCDCGAMETYPQDRLPHRHDLAIRRGSVTACSACRMSRQCAVCGKEFVAANNNSTCSEACRREHRKLIGNICYHRRMGRTKTEADAVMADTKLRRAMTDEERNTNRRAISNAWYAANSERVQSERKKRIATMTQEQLANWLNRMRAYGRAYRKRWRSELYTNPERHQVYIDLMREYRRQRALTELVAKMDQKNGVING